MKKKNLACIGIVAAIMVSLCACSSQENPDKHLESPQHITEEQSQEISSDSSNSAAKVSINTNIVCKDSDAPANLMIYNDEDNSESWRVTISRQDNGDCVYESDIIPVGYSVDESILQSSLPKGKYPCIASFHILDEDGNDKSVVNVDVQITVLH